MENNLLVPIKTNKKKMKFKKWVENNFEELKDIYIYIKKYDKEIDFLNECEFPIFCSFCYDMSNVNKMK